MTSVDTNYTFSGREDDGNGLMYYRNRYYSPTMKRFISEDPIGLNGGINQYAYVGGNPLAFNDPSGEILNFVGDKNKVEQALAYLSPDSEAGIIFKELDSSSTVITIEIRATTGNQYQGYHDSDGNPADAFSALSHTIYWDPNLAACDGSGNTQSPAMGLLHEATHADHYIKNPALYYERLNTKIEGGIFQNYENLEEFLTQTGVERRAAIILGEGIRNGHGGYNYPVVGVNKR